MVSDDIKNIAIYGWLEEGIRKGLEFLQTADFSSMPDGKHEIDGERLYVVVRTYQTKPLPECRWEAHKKYVDLQYLISGEELIGYANINELRNASQYDEDKDIYFLNGDGAYKPIRPGEFMVFWPEDAHMPEVSKGSGCTVRKAVVKVAV